MSKSETRTEKEAEMADRKDGRKSKPNEKVGGKRVPKDGMTKAAFVKAWVKTGKPPDDPYMRRLTRNGLADCDPVRPELRTAAVAEMLWRMREDRKALVGILRRPRRIGECLEEYNLWRRGVGKYAEGGCEPPFSAYMVGKLIEGAVGHLLGRETEVLL